MLRGQREGSSLDHVPSLVPPGAFQKTLILMSIPPNSALRPPDHVAGKVMDGEVVAINLRTGLYYSSSGIGAIIWQLMEAGETVEGIAAKIAHHFKVPSDTVRADVTSFVQSLLDEGLIEVLSSALPRDSGDSAIAYEGVYEAPSLMRFDDMEQAFALDPPLRA